jgi:hypothetical protein
MTPTPKNPVFGVRALFGGPRGTPQKPPKSSIRNFPKNVKMAGFWPPGQKPQKIGVGLGMLKTIKNQKNPKNPKVRVPLTFASGGQKPHF